MGRKLLVPQKVHDIPIAPPALLPLALLMDALIVHFALLLPHGKKELNNGRQDYSTWCGTGVRRLDLLSHISTISHADSHGAIRFS